MRNNINILYAEDDKSLISFIKVIFKKINFVNVTFTNNGKEALELYKKDIQNYQIVITDMIMPIMDGFELIKNIKNINKNQIIIMATAMENKEELIKAIELKINFFIEKPIETKKFKTILTDAINLAKKEKSNRLSQLLLTQYKEIIDESSIVSKTDTNGIITFVNDKFSEISGYTKEELIGKSHKIVRHKSMNSDIFKDLWYTIKELKQTWYGKIKNRKKDGSIYWIQATIKPILDKDRNIIEYIGIRTDITEQEKIKEYFESQLQISTKQFDNTLNLSKQYEVCMDKTNAIIRTNTNNIITYVNKEFCNISKYSSEELIGNKCSKIRDKSHIENDCNKVQEKLKNKEIVSMLFKNISKIGDFFYMNTIIYPIKDIDNNIIEYLHLMHNITPIIELNKEIEDTQKEVVFTMGAIGETRSKETGNHVKRVAKYSYLLAKLAGLDEKDAQLIKLASPMHDIGKVGIPDSILNKPAKLTKNEFEIMKTHSQIAYDMLKGSTRAILKASSYIALEHHERWDGNGYPNGKSGEDIHIYGRITAICDVFDALGSDRCYKKAWELEKILKLFKYEQGKHFDPRLTQLFFDNLDKFLLIRDKYID